jgi:uncharacterized protein (DUF2062 family)
MAFRILETLLNKILIPFRLIPEEGLSAEKLAFSVTLGLIAGMFPVIGATTILSIMLTIIFRQNILVVQSVQWIMALAQVLLIVPFMQFGAYILNQRAIHISIEQILLAFQPGILEGIKTIGIFHLYAILTWTLLSIPIGAVSYFVFKAIFQKRNIAIPIERNI